MRIDVNAESQEISDEIPPAATDADDVRGTGYWHRIIHGTVPKGKRKRAAEELNAFISTPRRMGCTMGTGGLLFSVPGFQFTGNTRRVQGSVYPGRAGRDRKRLVATGSLAPEEPGMLSLWGTAMCTELAWWLYFYKFQAESGTRLRYQSCFS